MLQRQASRGLATGKKAAGKKFDFSNQTSETHVKSAAAIKLAAIIKENTKRRMHNPVKVEQPAPELVKQRQIDVAHYHSKMHQLRHDLQVDGVHLQTQRNIQLQKIALNDAIHGNKYTQAEKDEKKNWGLYLDHLHKTKVRKNFLKKDTKRLVNLAVRKHDYLAVQKTKLGRQVQEMAREYEWIWEQPVEKEMEYIVPVNAAYLGVLPKEHHPLAGTYGDDLEQIHYVFGPPHPLTGWDARSVQILRHMASEQSDISLHYDPNDDNRRGNNKA